MDYFDPTYFDPTYFDCPAAQTTTGRGGRGLRRPLPLDPIALDEDLLWIT